MKSSNVCKKKHVNIILSTISLAKRRTNIVAINVVTEDALVDEKYLKKVETYIKCKVQNKHMENNA